MQTWSLLLLLLPAAALARSNGSPQCYGLDEPNHPKQPGLEPKDLQLVSFIDQSEDNPNDYFVSFFRHESKPIKGILLRPNGDTEGSFTSFDEEKYQVIEENCLTHKNAKAVKEAQMVTFTVTNGNKPTFDVFVVGAGRPQWWTTTIA